MKPELKFKNRTFDHNFGFDLLGVWTQTVTPLTPQNHLTAPYAQDIVRVYTTRPKTDFSNGGALINYIM